MIWNKLRQTYDVIGLEEIASGDRYELERACRAQSQAAYLGSHTAVCKILGRYKFYIDTRDQGFGTNVLLDGYWEMWLTKVIAQRVKPGMIAIDIGANFGYYSLLMADLIGAHGTLIAVEPNQYVTHKLQASLQLNGFASRSRIVKAAAGDSNEGEVLLFSTPLEPKNATVVAAEHVIDPALATLRSVPSWTPASIVEEFGRIDFIKIDAEGSEAKIIKGLVPLLSNHKPEIILEFNAARYTNPGAVLDELASHYAYLRVVGYAGVLELISREKILTENFGEDWLLCFSMEE